MTEILIATWDGGGNVPPALLIGRELQARGHGVHVIGHDVQQADVAAAGLAFTAYPTADRFAGSEPNSVPRMAGLFSDRKIGADVVAEAARQGADVVLLDCMLTGAVRACDVAGVPYVTIEHLYDGFLRGPWLKGPMGLVSRVKGLRPVRSWDRAHRALVVSLAELDPAAARARRPDNLIWTGPVLDLPAAHDLTAHPPAVLISLSTFNFPGMAQALQNLLDATADLDARVIVTTGPVVDPADLRVAPHHEVHRFVPHDELMPQVSLVVGHGGHATTMRALAHDLPLVVMPMHPMLDQPLVGKTVAAAGAGRVVAKKATPEELAPVIAELLADGPHRAAAARLGAAIRTANGTATAADQVLAAIGTGNGVPQG
jgi:UDP:flavonoid glycosyltransferase YjiC (YdhE family)